MAITVTPQSFQPAGGGHVARLSVSADADAACVAAVLAGDRQRYAELVDRYQRVVYVVIRGYVSDPHAAEDAAQEIFINAFTNLHTLREPAQFQAWLLQIARHHAARAGRRQDRRIDREPIVGDAPAPEAQPQPMSVTGRIEELPEPYRTTLLKKYVQEQSCKEIAAAEGVKIGTITSRLARGLEMLRTALK